MVEFYKSGLGARQPQMLTAQPLTNSFFEKWRIQKSWIPAKEQA